MSNRVLPSLLVSLAAIAVLAGCTEPTQGQPAAQPSSAPPDQPSETNKPSASATPRVQIPPRPKELKLDGIDPCTLLTEAQQDQLKIDRQPRSKPRDSAHRVCFLDVIDTKPGHFFAVRAITNEGIEPWLSGDRNVDAWLVTIAGFPAAQFKTFATTKADCSTSVDVAEGQQLAVQLTQDSSQQLNQDQMCQLSQQAAELATQTLQTLR